MARRGCCRGEFSRVYRGGDVRQSKDGAKGERETPSGVFDDDDDDDIFDDIFDAGDEIKQV